MRALLIVSIAAFGLGVGLTWQVQSWRYDARISEYMRSAAEAQTSAVEQAQEVERERYRQLQLAEQAARTREQRHRDAAAAARAESDGLRDDITRIRSELSRRTDAAVREYAATAGELLGECSERYQRMADTAQRHADDVKLLLDSWPDWRATDAND